MMMSTVLVVEHRPHRLDAGEVALVGGAGDAAQQPVGVGLEARCRSATAMEASTLDRIAWRTTNRTIATSSTTPIEIADSGQVA